MKVLMHEDIAHYSTACRVVFEVVQNAVYLVHIALGIVVFYTKLIAVCLAYASAFVSPCVPNVTVEVVDVVGLFLPNPQNFVDCRLECGFS